MDETYRQKVWDIINTIQSNQLFVHSSILEVKFPTEETMNPGEVIQDLSANGAVLKRSQNRK